ncbi:SRPBCC family protein [Puia dinghuensis]|uniref:Activator of HSP90 ATPase n=1 Tax=Puia dinghuensis TaxID=1792502 RepID=A0A8J2UDI9_9BACT|nr:SRPBCC domain-containing protein [Puia dinghuensis]GGB01436.1 activator of HSP90 ATPase [Puia dinghuensis]
MNNNLLFDFTVDKVAKTLYITREFDADLSLVWDAFTKQEILDQWWAPKPFESKTKVMEFKVGGRRFYAMVGPEGEEHWGVQKYTLINPKTNIKWLSSFTDKEENINAEIPTSEWELNFGEQNGTTKVSIAIKHKTLANIEMLIQMGFKEGFTMTLNELETLLQEQKK